MFKNNSNITLHLGLGVPSGLFPSGFLTKTLDALVFSPVHAKCSDNHLLLDLLTLIIFGEQYK